MCSGKECAATLNRHLPALEEVPDEVLTWNSERGLSQERRRPAANQNSRSSFKKNCLTVLTCPKCRQTTPRRRANIAPAPIFNIVPSRAQYKTKLKSCIKIRFFLLFTFQLFQAKLKSDSSLKQSRWRTKHGREKPSTSPRASRRGVSFLITLFNLLLILIFI